MLRKKYKGKDNKSWKKKRKAEKVQIKKKQLKKDSLEKIEKTKKADKEMKKIDGKSVKTGTVENRKRYKIDRCWSTRARSIIKLLENSSSQKVQYVILAKISYLAQSYISSNQKVQFVILPEISYITCNITCQNVGKQNLEVALSYDGGNKKIMEADKI